MRFSLLAQNLHPTAEAAREYFARNHGAKGFRSESAIDGDINFCLKPTLLAKLNDGGILCIEVSERAYSNSLDTFVVECSARTFPVKLYVVIPSMKGDPEFSANLRKAKERGVGVIQLNEEGSFLATDAVSLSLFGLHKLKLGEFPKDKREAVRQAEQTFLDGNPVKGCQQLFEELEAVTRAFAIRSKAEGWWRAPHVGEPPPKAKLAKGSWANVLRELDKFLDWKSCHKKCPLLKESLLSSVRGVTEPRNLTSHKPSAISDIVERDRKLRTWFENVGDLLKSWHATTKHLKL